MKKILFSSMACLLLLLLSAPVVQASATTITHDYGETNKVYPTTGTDPIGPDYVNVRFNSDVKYGDIFDISTITTDYSKITGINITLTYSGAANQDFLFGLGNERWYVREDDPQSANNDYYSYTTSDFKLANNGNNATYAFNATTMGTDGWAHLLSVLDRDNGIFSLVFSEEGLGAAFGDYNFNLYSAALTVEGVAATPIPGAAWLLGSGLVGLMGLRRKIRN